MQMFNPGDDVTLTEPDEDGDLVYKSPLGSIIRTDGAYILYNDNEKPIMISFALEGSKVEDISKHVKELRRKIPLPRNKVVIVYKFYIIAILDEGDKKPSNYNLLSELAQAKYGDSLWWVDNYFTFADLLQEEEGRQNSV